MKRAALFFVAFVFLFSANGLIAFAGCGGGDGGGSDRYSEVPPGTTTVAIPAVFTPDPLGSRSLYDLYRLFQLTDYPNPYQAELEDISPLERALSDGDGLGSERAWCHQVMQHPWWQQVMQLSEEEVIEELKYYR